MNSPKPSSRSTADSDSNSVSHEARLDLYKVAVEEYRFQVDLNWKRTQYFLAFNVALITIATSIATGSTSHERILPCGLYVLAAVSAALCWMSTRTQHTYYRAARDRMREIGEDLGLGVFAVATTPGAGSSTPRIASVTTLTTVILTLLIVLNVTGFIVVLIS